MLPGAGFGWTVPVPCTLTPGPSCRAQAPLLARPAVRSQKAQGVLDGKMSLVHALLIGVVPAACRYTRCIVASWGFLPASERLMTGGEHRIPFRNLGPCSGEDRDKLGALAPGVPVRGGGQQLGCQCRARRPMKSPSPRRKRFLRRVSACRTMSAICTSQSVLRKAGDTERRLNNFLTFNQRSWRWLISQSHNCD